MIKLLRANLLRLVKSKTFIACLAIQAGLTLMITLNVYLVNLAEKRPVADMVFDITACSPYGAALLAVMSSIFMGYDYHNGTIRNKLIIGYSRYEIYFANLITCAISALCLNLSAMAVFYPVSLPLLYGFAGEPLHLFKIFSLGWLIMLVYASLYTAVAMTTKNTVAPLIITIASLFVFMMLAQYMISQINAPLEWTDYIYNEAGEFVPVVVPNPHRLSEGVLKFFGVCLNIFPSGQMTILSSEKLVGWQSALSSVCIIVLSSAAGIALFRKENIN